jgi:5-formyltetrahydrofolate cyclo-ligase
MEKKEMDNSSIARINELYHKSKSVGLTQEEKEEQQRLRKEFVQAVRANLRGQLNNISLVDENGNVENLSDRVKH